jgi:hypothetical protein
MTEKPPIAIKTWQDIDNIMMESSSYHDVLEKIFLRTVQRKQLTKSVNVDDVTWADIVKNEVESIELIHSWLKKSDKKMSPVKEVIIEQENKNRKIYTLNLVDKWLLSNLSTQLSSFFVNIWSKHLYSFQKGKNVWNAHEAFNSYQKLNKGKNLWIIQLDVSQYGDSIDQQIVLNKLDKYLGKSSSISREILKSHMRTEFIQVDETHACFYKGIPAGSPLVPFIENLYLIDLDFLLEKQAGFYARFGDDILLADVDRSKVESCFALIQAEIELLGLKFKPAKVIWTLFGEDNCSHRFMKSDFFEWLGHRVSAQRGYGPKLHQAQRFHRIYRRNLKILLAQLERVPMTKNEKLQSLSALFNKSTNYKSMPEVLTICLGQRNPSWLKQEDIRIREIFVNMTHKRLSIPKKEIWKCLAKAQINSLNRQRRHLLKVIPWN